MGNQKRYDKNETTSYNMKLERYPGRMSITSYDQPITKLTEDEKERRKHDKKTAKHYQPDPGDTEQRTWNNPKTGKVEIIPEGWHTETWLYFNNPDGIFDVKGPFMNDEMMRNIEERIDTAERITELVPDPEYLPEGFFKDFDGWRSESGTWDEDGHFHPDEVMTLEQMKIHVAERVEDEKYKQRQIYRLRNIRRTKQSIYEITKANIWNLFVTITINPDACDRSDLKACKELLHKKIHKLRERKGLEFGYIIVPELHKDRINWHFHGLFKDIEGIELKPAKNAKTGEWMFTKKGDPIYNLPQFESIGWTTATLVFDTVSVAKYITKYITKSLLDSLPNQRTYLTSKGLDRAEVRKIELYELDQLPDMLPELFELEPENLELCYHKGKINPYTGGVIDYMEFKDGRNPNELGNYGIWDYFKKQNLKEA